MEDSDDGKNNATFNGPMKSILKKYNHRRRVKRTDSSSSWKGGAKQKFSPGSSGSSSSAASSESESEDNAATASKKSGTNQSVPEESTRGSTKKNFRSAKDSQGSASSDEDNPFLTSKKEFVQQAALSESEPEDENALKVHLEKLQARKSRINSNASNMSTANRQPTNKTLNLTSALNKSKFIPARLSEVSPDLLGLSSSSDEEEPNKVKFLLNDSDEDATPTTSSTLSKRKSSATPKKSDTEDTESSDYETSINKKGPSPSKLMKTVEEPAEYDLEQPPLLPNRKTPTKSPNLALKRSSKRISTPQPKDLGLGKVLNKSKRKSRLSEARASKNGLGGNSSSSPKASKSLASVVSPKGNLPTSPVKFGSPIAPPIGTPSLMGPKSPSFESNVMNEVLKESTIGDSDVLANTSSTTKVGSGRKPKKTPVRKSLRGKSLVTEGPPKVTPTVDDQRTLRSSAAATVSSPEKNSPQKTPSKLVSNLIQTRNNLLTQVRPLETLTVPRFVAGCAGGGVRFMASSRIANDQDPIQYSLLYDGPTLFMILWKLQPNTVNYSRTRGETCILVLEGQIKMDDEEYPRGNVIKIPGSSTYSVINNGQMDALYQVTEYL